MLRFLFDFRNARFAVLLLLVVLAIAAVVLFHAVVLPFFLAAFLAYLLNPLVSWIRTHGRIGRFHVPRSAAVLIVYAVLATALGLGSSYAVPKLVAETNRLAESLPAYLDNLDQNFMQPLGERLDRLVSSYSTPTPATPEAEGVPAGEGSRPLAAPATFPVSGSAPKRSDPAMVAARHLVEDYVVVLRPSGDGRIEVDAYPRRPGLAGGQGLADGQGLKTDRPLKRLLQNFRDDLGHNVGGMVDQARRVLSGLSRFAFDLFLVFMLAGFILVDPARIRNFLRSTVPDAYQPAYDTWVDRLDRGMSGVVRGQVMICLINGVLTGIGISVLGVPFWLALSLTATVFSLVPVFGVLISSIPIVLIALTVSLRTALLAFVWIVLIHLLEGNFLNPKVLGDAAKIHPVLILFALVVGQYLAGITGALLAVPTFSLFYNSLKFLKTQAEALEHRTA